jgi:hypothetical protein
LIPLIFSLVASGQVTYYLPYVADGPAGQGSLKTTFVVENTSPTSATVTLSLLRDDGSPLPLSVGDLGMRSDFSFDLKPGASRILASNGTGPGTPGAARLTSNVSVAVAAYLSRLDASGNLAQESAMSHADVVTDFVAPVEAGEKLNTGIVVWNFGTAEATVTFRLLDAEGREMRTATQKLAAKTRMSRLVGGELFSGLGEFRGVLIGSSSVPLATSAWRQNTTGATLTLLPVTSGAQSRSAFYLLLVTDGASEKGSVRARLLLFSLTANPATARVEFFQEDGTPWPVTLSGQAADVAFDVKLKPNASTFLETSGTGELVTGAAKVSSEQPIGLAVLRAAYDTDGNLQSQSFLGDPIGLRQLVLPLDTSGGAEASFALFNPAHEPVSLTARLLDPDGAVVDTAVLSPLAGRARASVSASSLFPSAIEFRGSISIKTSESLTGTVAALGLRRNDAASSLVCLRAAPVQGTANPINITLTVQSSRGASATIPATGGTLTATAADGTRFTLVIPDKALLEPATITMTPVASVRGLPLSGGMTAAVQLEPDGLQLNRAATLTIETPSSIALDAMTPLGWYGAGENLYLNLFLPGEKGIVLPVHHFSGYGVGQGTGAERQDIIDRTDLSDQTSSRISEATRRLLDKLRNKERTSLEDFDDLQDEFQNYMDTVIKEALASGNVDFVECVLHQMSMERRWQLVFDYAGKAPPVPDSARKALDLIEKDAIDGCLKRQEPWQLDRIWAHEGLRFDLGISGGPSYSELQDIANKCLTFDLEFSSEMVVQSENGKITSLVASKSKVRLRQSPPKYTASGSAPLEYKSLVAEVPNCSYTSVFNATTFRVFESGGNAQTLIEFQPKPYSVSGVGFYCGGTKYAPAKLTLVLDPGNTTESVTLVCDGARLVLFAGIPWWRNEWNAMHAVAFPSITSDGRYVIRDWEVPGGQLWARKAFNRSVPVNDGTLTEKTLFELWHRP